MTMVEIEDRGIIYKSWKSYAKALQREVRGLQQFLPSKQVQIVFNRIICEVEKGNLRGRISIDNRIDFEKSLLGKIDANVM